MVQSKPDFVDDVHTGLLQKGVCDEAARDGHPPCSSFKQLLTKAAPLHHMRTKAFSSINHRHQHGLE